MSFNDWKKKTLGDTKITSIYEKMKNIPLNARTIKLIKSKFLILKIGKLSIKFNIEQDCCEKFDVVDLKTKKSLLKKKNNTNILKEKNLKITNLEYKQSGEKNIFDLSICDDKSEVMKIRFSNEHNGYYSHDFLMFYDDDIFFKSSL